MPGRRPRCSVAYVLFLAAFTYAIGFVSGFVVPKTIDSGVPGPFWPSVAVNALLLTVFAVQHSVMARPGFKEVWTATEGQNGPGTPESMVLGTNTSPTKNTA